MVYMLTSIVPVGLSLLIFFGPYSVIDLSFDETHNKK